MSPRREATPVLLDKSILIHAPAGRIYELLQPSRQPLWDRSLVRVAARDDTMREGSLFDRVARALGHRFESASEAIALRKDRLFAWRQVEGDFEEHRGAYTLEPQRDGTLVHLVADVELPFVLPRLATEAEVRAGLSRDADDALFNLKALCEKASSRR